MLAVECARVLRYRDSYLLFHKNRSLLKIIATQQDKDYLIQQELIPYSHRSRQTPLVSARSMFRQFGARVIEGGRRVRDDYWEADAVNRGFTEEDMPGHAPAQRLIRWGAAGQAEDSQDGAAQLFADLPMGDLTPHMGEGESFVRSGSSVQDTRTVDPIREQQPSPQQPSPSIEGRDSRIREDTLLPTSDECLSSSTANTLTQRSFSPVTLAPEELSFLKQHENDHPGRMDAFGPPSPDHPTVSLLSLYSIEQNLPSLFAIRFGRCR